MRIRSKWPKHSIKERFKRRKNQTREMKRNVRMESLISVRLTTRRRVSMNTTKAMKKCMNRAKTMIWKISCKCNRSLTRSRWSLLLTSTLMSINANKKIEIALKRVSRAISTSSRKLSKDSKQM
jgi:hypothetical protein